ncbi:hypothetical protein [Bradyrhizobium lablabi]|uniref:hypothetical protein n=1 Tax=Bradyrhizobium lablabi TaxID=722472 RepID=UPI001BA43C7A|nr:hypothetical protein [Bradyrhizobium lablabi]MBR0692777.1 hypothetical protein [Bradyrhizobium lablabi]
MKWMKERDLLIAQTMAFVQSVTGKRPSAEVPIAAPRIENPAAAPPPLPVVAEAPPTIVPGPAVAASAQEPATTGAQPVFAKLDIRGDFQSEVQARVANFRANQERFIREREAYSNATMAKVRATLRDNGELPRSGE